MNDMIEVVTTVPSKGAADAIARALVTAKLAACVQIDGPVQSVYRWHGDVETAQEWRCTMKTRWGCYARLEDKILELHPYEVPEILWSEMAGGNRDYRKWLAEQVS